MGLTPLLEELSKRPKYGSHYCLTRADYINLAVIAAKLQRLEENLTNPEIREFLQRILYGELRGGTGTSGAVGT